MGNYIELNITAEPAALELLVARLADAGCNGFEESGNTLKAYIPEESYEENVINIILNQPGINHSISIIGKQNWNALWESNFEPVRVGDFAGIRADFHGPFDGVAHEIVITPKMSFGTGHHATTFMMMQLMQQIDFSGKTVFDFGTGTGILAILAEKLGAGRVAAVDNDDWCIENASENISINNCKNIEIQKVDSVPAGLSFDIILANINKHIITANIAALAGAMADNGVLLLSGLLEEDEEDIINLCNLYQLTHHRTERRNGWIALWFF